MTLRVAAKKIDVLLYCKAYEDMNSNADLHTLD